MIFLIILATIVLFWKLGQGSLDDWDEAIYAQVSKEIVQSGDWVVLHRGYTPWFHKPPLFMWTTALFYQLFGVNEFWSRAASALAGVGVVAVTYAIGKSVYNIRTGWLAGIVLLSSYLFTRQARFGTTDIMLTLWMCLAIYSYIRLRSSANTNWWYGVWSMLGLAFMTKGIASFTAFFSVGLFILSDRPRQDLKTRRFWLGVLTFAFIVLPWHIAVFARHGSSFLGEYIGYHVVQRATASIEGHQGTPEVYIDVLQNWFFPWFYLLPIGIAAMVRENLREKADSKVILIFVSVVFTVFSLAQTKLAWYITPAMPMLAILIGMTLDRALKDDDFATSGTIVACAIAAIAGPAKVEFLSDRQAVLVSLVLLAVLLAVVSCINLAKKANLHAVIVSLLFCSLLVFGLGEVKGLYNGKFRAEAKISQLAAVSDVKNTDSIKPLMVFKLSENLDHPVALFYSNRPVVWIRNPEEIVQHFDKVQDEPQEAILSERDIQNISGQYEVEIIDKVENLAYVKIEAR